MYQLLTDQGFLNEAAVWQTLSDVDASFSEFVTASFEAWQLQAQDSPADTSSNSMTKEQQITSELVFKSLVLWVELVRWNYRQL